MFQHEEMRYEWESEAPGSRGYTRGEDLPFSSSAGQKLIPHALGQAPTVGQRFALALVSLGMLMGMSTLLTILATRVSTSGWVEVPVLFVLILFTVAVISINIVFNRRSW